MSMSLKKFSNKKTKFFLAISSEILFCFYKIDFFYESKTYQDTTKALKKKP